MKNFRIQINAYQYYADFNIQSLDGPLDIENAIIDKLGENSIKWEYTGDMYDTRRYKITYEEVINGDATTTSKRPLHEKKGSGPRMGAGASERG